MSDENGNGDNGHYVEVVRNCPDCHRPTDDEGLTLFEGTNRSRDFIAPTCRTCHYGSRPLTVWRRNNPEKQAENFEKAVAASRKRGSKPKTVSDVMAERMEMVVDKILKPYFEALDLEPMEHWSPRTKLQFFAEQSQMTEKMFNRTEGMPVARQRNVDRDDNDVLPQLKTLPPAALERILAATLADIELSDEDVLELAGDTPELEG